MVTEFIRGQSIKFIAEISFGLNWDDKEMRSVKISKGQEVEYDGEVAAVDNGVGIIRGRCMGLKSAINVMGWLKPVGNGYVSETAKAPKVVSGSLFEEESNGGGDYDPRTGGNLDAYMKYSNREKKHKVIKEDDLIVKEIPSLKTTKKGIKTGKLEVAGDQVVVPKERLVVSSSTVRTKMDKRDVKVAAADEMGADTTLPLKSNIGVPKKTPESKTFTVDDTTPRQIREDMTNDELQRITRRVVEADDSQDATVVKKLDTSKEPVQEVEGVILKKISSPKDVKFNAITSSDGVTVKTTVGASKHGGSVGDQGAVVVGVSKTAKNKAALKDALEEAPPLTEEEKKIAAEKLAEREKKAKARAESRKKRASATQKLMEEEKKKPSKREVKRPKSSKKESALKPDQVPELVKEIPSKREVKRPKSSKKESALKPDQVPELVKEIKQDEDIVKISDQEGTTDYLLSLPDNWNKMHWVKKEKFIKEIDDIFFVKFILSMETTKAVKNACLERIEQLEQKKSGEKNTG